MAFHWQSKNIASVGVEDLVLLSRVNEQQITENLKKRFGADQIYTYIGPSLIAVNPYKKLPYFTQKELQLYNGSNAYENPPHIYAVAERMWQNLISDGENQCVIISGESGAGKTESSKLVMNYISEVSAKDPTYGNLVEEVKNIIMESNPLLESFGNAKTLRNNNSSRFGKYFEINFLKSGSPIGGKISNFLLEKSRVVGLKPGERNFHIFYQITQGAPANVKEELGIVGSDYFNYLRSSGEYHADGIDDAEEYKAMRHAMQSCKISEQTQTDVLRLVAGILHLGNVVFLEKNNEAYIRDPKTLEYPAYLLGVSSEELVAKLTSRTMRTGAGGKRGSLYQVPLNEYQAAATRDALSKTLYARLFDYIVGAVNTAMQQLSSRVRDTRILSIGVLDIYGFEIFERNGFEQFCINYVNERLQQIFIELTLRQEQEEYIMEGIEWTPIDYFNNKVVVDLIESKKPPGIMPVLDDACFTMHAVQEGADTHFLSKLAAAIGPNKHFQGGSNFFVVNHYAGSVSYAIDGFTEANKDTVFKDLIALMKGTSSQFIQALFPEEVDWDDRKRPTTAGFKIRNQCQDLVTTLMKCVPSYIRCIKPNDNKKSGEFDDRRVEHQVRYLNLKENVRVRRAGYCYRGAFDKFFRRYCIIEEQLMRNPSVDVRQGISRIMSAANMPSNEWQMGKTKVFVRAPESLFSLEELRDRKYDGYAKKIQRAFRSYLARRLYLQLKKKTIDVLGGRKERRRQTLNRTYVGDYIGFRDDPILQLIVGKKEKCYFADNVIKYDREFKPTTWDRVLTGTAVFFVGWEKCKQGPEKGKLVKVLKRKLTFNEITKLSLSTKADDMIVIHVRGSYDQVVKSVLKTEFVVLLSQKYNEVVGQPLAIDFNDVIIYAVKKTTFQSGGSQELNFVSDSACNVESIKKSTSKKYEVRIAQGLPKNSMPKMVDYTPARRAPTRPAPTKSISMESVGQALPKQPVQNVQPAQPAHPSPPRPQFPPPPQPSPPTAQPARAPQPVSAPVVQQSITEGLVSARKNDVVTNNSSVRTGGAGPIRGGFNYFGGVAAQGKMTPTSSTGNLVNNSTTGNGSIADVRPNASASNLASAEGENGSAADLLAAALKKKAPPPPPPKAKALPRAKALYDYVASEADEISFKAGDILTITSKDDPGWWSGALNGKKGLIPANYWQEI